MSLVAQFKDGQFVTNTASSESLSNAKEKNSSGINSDTFLQLLVAEMQNQDPLEPTSNTEWVSQYATFTQVSAVTDIQDAMSSMQAKNLVGEYVILKVTNDKGNTDYVSGKVDYVTYEENKAYLSVNGSLYSIDDLDTVASSEYMDAYELASDIADAIKSLPSVDNLTTSFKDKVYDLKNKANGMTDYQKTFLDKSVFDKIDEYYQKMVKLVENDANAKADAENAKKEVEKVVEKEVEKEVEEVTTPEETSDTNVDEKTLEEIAEVLTENVNENEESADIDNEVEKEE